ncbi:MAG: hypothetical protein SGILL_001703, partial [Bacillariaceae sp.]
AECHIQLMELALQRNIPKITIVNRTLERARVLQSKIESERSGDDGHATTTTTTTIESVALNDKEAVRRALLTADVVSATTNTTTPLWSDDDNMQLKKGCLITGIGSYTPEMQEIPNSVVNRSVVVIDTPEAMEVGDLKHLGTSVDCLASQHPISMAGNALQEPERVLEQKELAQKDFVLFKAVGSAIQDVLQAKVVVDNAKQLHLGHDFDMA